MPIGQATVQVSAPAAVTRAACFAGPSGSTGSCQQAGIAEGVAHFTQASLGPHEGLTVVVAIPKGVVAVPRPVLVERWSLERAFAVTPVSAGAAGGLLAVFAILGAVVLVRRRDGRNPRSAAHGVAGTAVPASEAVPLSGHGQPAMESAPPEDVRPGQAGTLLDGLANPRDATGTIVDLAVRGYLRIEDGLTVLGGLTKREKPDWQLVRLGKTGGLLDYEQILLDGLFEDYPSTQDGAPSTLLSELGPAFARSLKQAQEALYKDVASRGWFTARPDQVRRRWLMIGCVLFAAGAVAIVVAAARSHLGLIPVPVALAGLVLIGGARWMPARTAKGTELARRLLGFRRYLTTAPAGQARPAGASRAARRLPALRDRIRVHQEMGRCHRGCSRRRAGAVVVPHQRAIPAGQPVFAVAVRPLLLLHAPLRHHNEQLDRQRRVHPPQRLLRQRLLRRRWRQRLLRWRRRGLLGRWRWRRRRRIMVISTHR